MNLMNLGISHQLRGELKRLAKTATSSDLNWSDVGSAQWTDSAPYEARKNYATKLGAKNRHR
jgi:hypothetical protein